jgi:hypothetical protein
VRIPPFPFFDTVFTSAKFNFSITLLCTTHGPVDILAHRHKREQLPPTPSPTLSREAATASAGEDYPSFPFLSTIFTTINFFFNCTATHHPRATGILVPQTQERAAATNVPSYTVARSSNCKRRRAFPLLSFFYIHFCS